MKEKVRLERGLVLIRFAAPGSGTPSALVKLSIMPDDRNKGQIIMDPFATGDSLTAPGHCAVVECRAPLTVEVNISSALNGEAPRGSIRIEYLTRASGRSVGSTEQAASVSPAALAKFGLIGHVAYKGDVSVANGAWLCGPDNPNRIEGLRLVWPDKPDGLEVRVGTPRGEQMGLGEYVGSRGKSAPLSGLSISLGGISSGALMLNAEAQFLKAGLVRADGKAVVLSGTGQRDELIGLRLSLEAIPSYSTFDKEQVQNSRVRIFRVD